MRKNIRLGETKEIKLVDQNKNRHSKLE